MLILNLKDKIITQLTQTFHCLKLKITSKNISIEVFNIYHHVKIPSKS